jgi:hypothetical protein
MELQQNPLSARVLGRWIPCRILYWYILYWCEMFSIFTILPSILCIAHTISKYKE